MTALRRPWTHRTIQARALLVHQSDWIECEKGGANGLQGAFCWLAIVEDKGTKI